MPVLRITKKVRQLAISPWENKVLLVSPDGSVTASITDASEIAMGGPTSGDLKLSNGMSRSSCNPSIVWSNDSEYLAVPQWTGDRKQRLMIISISQRKSWYIPGEYRVLQLESFENGIVRGIDSPAFMPRRIEADISIIN